MKNHSYTNQLRDLKRDYEQKKSSVNAARKAEIIEGYKSGTSLVDLAWTYDIPIAKIKKICTEYEISVQPEFKTFEELTDLELRDILGAKVADNLTKALDTTDVKEAVCLSYTMSNAALLDIDNFGEYSLNKLRSFQKKYTTPDNTRRFLHRLAEKREAEEEARLRQKLLGYEEESYASCIKSEEM